MFAYAKLEQKQVSKGTVQKKETPNLTGIPAGMKTRFESLSGFSFDDVRVHYNSDKPALLHALAYTQGDHVYVAPGQERHLGHVVQQKHGKVQPTGQIDGMYINENTMLEKEADVIRDNTWNKDDLEETFHLKESLSSKNIIQGVFILNRASFNLAYGGRGADGSVANKFTQHQKDAFVLGTGRNAIVAHSISFSAISNLLQKTINGVINEANELIQKCYAEPAKACTGGFADDLEHFRDMVLIFLESDLDDICIAVTNGTSPLIPRVMTSIRNYVDIVRTITVSKHTQTAHLPSNASRERYFSGVLDAANNLMTYLGTHINNLRIGFSDWNGILLENFDPISYAVVAGHFILTDVSDTARLKKMFLLKEDVYCSVFIMDNEN